MFATKLISIIDLGRQTSNQQDGRWCLCPPLTIQQQPQGVSGRERGFQPGRRQTGCPFTLPAPACASTAHPGSHKGHQGPMGLNS